MGCGCLAYGELLRASSSMHCMIAVGTEITLAHALHAHYMAAQKSISISLA